MIENEKLNRMKDVLGSDKFSINVFFITREIREGVKKSAKTVDKYDFRAWLLDVSPDVKKFFTDNVADTLDKVVSSDTHELEPYDVIADDLPDKLYTYALNNALSFSDVVSDQILPGKVDSISSLSEVKSNLWAYCLKIAGEEAGFLVFRKLSKGMVVTDQSQGVKDKLSSFFDSETAELKASKNESITFDDKVDCLFLEDEFFVFRKKGFESIVGLEEEFKTAAGDVVDILQATDLVEGVEFIESMLKESRSLLKTLSNIAKKGHHHKLNHDEIDKMKDVLHKFEGKELKLTDEGKLLLEDKNDVGYFVKLLNDYYKQGMVSGDYYGTNSGRLLNMEKVSPKTLASVIGFCVVLWCGFGVLL